MSSYYATTSNSAYGSSYGATTTYSSRYSSRPTGGSPSSGSRVRSQTPTRTRNVVAADTSSFTGTRRTSVTTRPYRPLPPGPVGIHTTVPSNRLAPIKRTSEARKTVAVKPREDHYDRFPSAGSSRGTGTTVASKRERFHRADSVGSVGSLSNGTLRRTRSPSVSNATPRSHISAVYIPERKTDSPAASPVRERASSAVRRADSIDGVRQVNGYDSKRSTFGHDDSSLIKPVATSSEKGKKRSGGLVGLSNLGNTCFMNSVLQCLSNTRPLLEYCLDDKYRGDINKTNSGMKGQLVEAYGVLMKDMWRGDGKSVAPTDFKAKIQRFAPRFVGYNQQDSQEFLRYLLEGLHEDVNRVKTKPKPEPYNEAADDRLMPEEKSRELWRRYVRRDDSQIVDMFVGQLRSTLKCTVCGHESVTFDPFWDLSVPVPKSRGKTNGSPSLEECIEAFMTEETLDDDESPTCGHCKKRQRSTKSFKLQKLPDILVVHLKRFSGERFRSKLGTRVSFRENLDLRDFVASPAGACQYQLYAVSNHSGSCYSGHYTAHAKHPYTGSWHSFNDTRVSSNSADSLSSSEAYVLFYEKLGTSRSHL